MQNFLSFKCWVNFPARVFIELCHGRRKKKHPRPKSEIQFSAPGKQVLLLRILRYSPNSAYATFSDPLRIQLVCRIMPTHEFVVKAFLWIWKRTTWIRLWEIDTFAIGGRSIIIDHCIANSVEQVKFLLNNALIALSFR